MKWLCFLFIHVIGCNMFGKVKVREHLLLLWEGREHCAGKEK